MATRELLGVARSAVIDTDAVLATSNGASGDFDNSTGTPIRALRGFCHLALTYDSVPAVGIVVAELYHLKGDDDQTSEVVATGSASVKPAAKDMIDTFVSVAPHATNTEVLQSITFEIPVGISRFVVWNVSGVSFNNTWEMRFIPEKEQVV